MLTVSNDSGCCGVKHLHGFSGMRESDTRTRMTALLTTAPNSGYFGDGRLIVVTLTSRQCIPWRLKLLKEFKFHFVSAFRNSNSGNRVNVFHRRVSPGIRQDTLLSDPPDGWNSE
jgi:hypothetical protein